MPCLETRPVDLYVYLSAFGVIVIARVQCNLADPWRPWYIITSGLQDYVQCVIILAGNYFSRVDSIMNRHFLRLIFSRVGAIYEMHIDKT